MSDQRRFSGKQITIMVVAVCVAIVGAPVTVMAATGNSINIVDPTHATQKAAVTAKSSVVTSERDPVTGNYARVDGGSLRVGCVVARRQRAGRQRCYLRPRPRSERKDGVAGASDCIHPECDRVGTLCSPAAIFHEELIDQSNQLRRNIGGKRRYLGRWHMNVRGQQVAHPFADERRLPRAGLEQDAAQ